MKLQVIKKCLQNIDLTARETAVAINEEANTAVAGTIKYKFNVYEQLNVKFMFVF